MNESKKNKILDSPVLEKNKDAKEESPLMLVVNFIVTFLLTLFVIIAIGLVALKIFGFSVYSVKTASMEPTYPVNSIVFVQKTNPASIEIGDTITYALNEEGDTVTHRVIEIDRDKRTFTTKGDNNNVEDAKPALWDNTVGRVVFSLPTGGKLFSFVSAEQNRPIMIVIIVALLGIALVWEIFDQVLKRKKHQNIKKIE